MARPGRASPAKTCSKKGVVVPSRHSSPRSLGIASLAASGFARVLSNRSLADASSALDGRSPKPSATLSPRHATEPAARREARDGQTAVTIAVADVQASSRWYGTLLDCASPLDPDHEHRELFDVLSDDSGPPVLFLTRWDHHPLESLRDEAGGCPGHGVVLSFEVDDVESSWRRAAELGARVVAEPHESRGFEVTEFTVVDPDGYHASVSEPIEV